jgi:predicted amidophosphoribosyltransferase
MTHDTWTCPQCGEEIEPQFTACWNCGSEGEHRAEQGESDSEQPSTEQLGEEHSFEEEAAESASFSEHETPETLMAQLLRNQQQQSEQLDSISYKVGCLFLCMMFFLSLIALQIVIAVVIL